MVPVVAWDHQPNLWPFPLQGPFVQKGLAAGHPWPDAASSEVTSSTPLMGACTALRGTAVTSWQGTARNAPFRLLVSSGHCREESRVLAELSPGVGRDSCSWNSV